MGIWENYHIYNMVYLFGLLNIDILFWKEKLQKEEDSSQDNDAVAWVLLLLKVNQ